MIWKPNERTAGHEFWPSGACLMCGRRWVDIRNCTRADVDAVGIAHYGKLTANEADQIERKRAEEDKAVEAAMAMVSGRGAPATVQALQEGEIWF